MIYVDAKEKPEIARVFSAAFPSYSGRKHKVSIEETVYVPSSYWDEGSKTSAVFIRLDSLETGALPDNHPFFDRARVPNQLQAGESLPLVPGIAMVTHSLFCGKDMGLTLHVHPQDVNPLALVDATPVELSVNERKCLEATRGFKASYGGISNYRQHMSGMSSASWNEAKQSLIGKGLLDKRGAITNKGKNLLAR